MIKSDYLYGIDISILANMPYKEVLIMKIHYSKKLMHELVHINNMQDSVRINKVHKSINFNKNLLKKLGLSEKDISKHLKEVNYHHYLLTIRNVGYMFQTEVSE